MPCLDLTLGHAVVLWKEFHSKPNSVHRGKSDLVTEVVQSTLVVIMMTSIDRLKG